MIIQNVEVLTHFIHKHADANHPVKRFIDIIEDAVIETPNELKQIFLSADNVGNHRWIINIKGNSYRIICIITFRAGIMFIRYIGTHAEYDKINAATI